MNEYPKKECVSDPSQPVCLERRYFIKSVFAVICGALAGLVPASIGVYFFTDPLNRKSKAGDLVRITQMEALPTDGTPRKFTVTASMTDAWNKFPRTPIGAVYLRRTGEKKIEALNVVCPHAGCFVDYLPGKQEYLCPCHRSTFTLNGAIRDPHSPSPRGMDALEVELRNDNEIWVKFQNFVAGQKAKIPTA
jgi:menaquinol-cytochrome c reductase iron-sulfur subunit